MLTVFAKLEIELACVNRCKRRQIWASPDPSWGLTQEDEESSRTTCWMAEKEVTRTGRNAAGNLEGSVYSVPSVHLRQEHQKGQKEVFPLSLRDSRVPRMTVKLHSRPVSYGTVR